MLELRRKFPLAGLLKIAGLARSTYYYQQKVIQSGDKYLELKAQIRAIFDRHKGRYGYRRITATLRHDGCTVNHKTVQRLMCQMRLISWVRLKKYNAYRGEVGKGAPNLLERRFEASKVNEKWVTDVTEFKVGSQKLYLSPVLDLHNGEIIAHEISKRPLFNMVSAMLKKAFARLKPFDKPILHSDQGWQYQMPIYGQMLRQQSIVPSMSRRGNCLDNAAMESFFGTLKSELYHLNEFRDVDHLKSEIEEYIRYYNCERIKLGLGGLSPMAYREKFSFN